MTETTDAPPLNQDKPAGPKPDGVRAWITSRLRREQWVYRILAIAIAPLAVAATVLTYVVLFVVFGFLTSGSAEPPADGGVRKQDVVSEADRSSGGFVAHLAAAAGLVGLFAVARRSTAPPWAPVRVRGETVNTLVRLSQMTGTGWLILLQSDRDLPGPIRIAADVTTFAPRLVQLAYAIGRRSFDIDRIDTVRLGKLVMLLLKARGRVALFELVERFPEDDPQELVDDLAAVEGVVFLTNDPPGVTLTPMVADEYIEWRTKKRQQLGLDPAEDDVKWRAV